jgi:Polyketide cyclase / dehydrase and lipid transport
MKKITDSIIINNKPEDVYNTLIAIFSSEENYRRWHPDHVTCRWLKRTLNEIGSVLFAFEYLNRRLFKMKFEITQNDKPHFIGYQLKFPHSLIFPNGSFEFKERNGQTIFIAGVTIRFYRIIKLLLSETLGKSKKHIEEEGVNLKRIVEVELN